METDKTDSIEDVFTIKTVRMRGPSAGRNHVYISLPVSDIEMAGFKPDEYVMVIFSKGKITIGKRIKKVEV